MPIVRKIPKIEGELEEKNVPMLNSFNPVYIPLKHILLILLVLIFIYQITLVQHDQKKATNKELEKWEGCLQEYVQAVCSTKIKKTARENKKFVRMPMIAW